MSEITDMRDDLVLVEKNLDLIIKERDSLRTRLAKQEETLNVLWKIARAAQEHVRWVVSENPNTSVEKLREALALLPPSDEGEKK